MEKQKHAEHLSLMDALDFDDADLQANAKGHLSERQRKLYRYRYARLMRWGLIFVGITAAVSLILMVVFSYNLCAASLLGAALMAMVGFLCFQPALKDWAALNTLLRFPVESVEGMVSLDVEVGSSKGSPQYVVKVGDMSFEVTKPGFLAFKNGDPYRIYYVTGGIVLSAESLRTE